MADPLKVIALISGGKDSLFSMLHCTANGLETVALANLYPPEMDDADEDLNSHMYQTVGHQIIPLYEKALGLPLYREKICGSNINEERDYSERAGDETESLTRLLQKVLKEHPEANAVSVGAILSDYQRTRVENVAVRLGLVPLAYLWHFPNLPPYTQSALLSDMQAVGQDARIIKVASGGLDEDFLWLNVADSRVVHRMKNAMRRYGQDGKGILVGEGGEYETLAIEGPSPLWKGRIEVEDDGVRKESGGTAVLKIKRGKVLEKAVESTNDLATVRRPDLFDDMFSRLLELELHTGTIVSSRPAGEAAPLSFPTSLHTKVGDTVLFSNLTGETKRNLPLDLDSQLDAIFQQLSHFVSIYGLHKTQIAHCTLLLRDMAVFQAVNKAYVKYFDFVNPPSRITVAVGNIIPTRFDVMLSAIARTGSTREGLHVQSRSYWAPANIGPYSQAITVPILASTTTADDGQFDVQGSEVHIAGQIPLEPASMEFLKGASFKEDAALSLQHLCRIGNNRGVTRWTAGVAFIPYTPHREEQDSRIALIQALWRALHEPLSKDDDDEAEHVDPWDTMNTLPSFNDSTDGSRFSCCNAVTTTHTDTNTTASSTPPCFVAEVSSLPRSASIEWASTGLTSSRISFTASGRTTQTQIETSASSSSSSSSSPKVSYLSLEIADEGDVEYVRSLQPFTHATLFVAGELEGWKAEGGVQWVPCYRVWGEGGREVRGVLVGRMDG